MRHLLSTFGALTTRRPRLALLLLIPLTVVVIAAGTMSGGQYVDDFSVPGIESQKAQDLIAKRFPGQGGDAATVVFTGSVKSAEVRAALDEVARQPHVSDVSPLSVSQDGSTAFSRVTYDKSADDLGARPRERLEHATRSLSGVKVAMSGPVIDAGAEGELPIGELAGVVMALVLLLVVLKSLRATIASLVVAIFGVAAGFALLGVAATGVDIPSLAPSMAAMLGIGAGIDYALLNAARMQEELRRGRSSSEAAAVTNGSAGESALTAAAIVLVSISGLIATGIPFLGKVGVATGAMVLTTALVAVLLLPAMFAAAGRKMLPRRDRHAGAVAADDDLDVEPAWAVRRPRTALAVGTVIAVALCIPAAFITIGQPDDGNLRADQTQRQAFDRLAAGFGPGFNGPLVMVVDGADAAGRAKALAEKVSKVDGVASVQEASVNDSGRTALFTVIPATGPQDSRTADLLRELRRQSDDALVGGYTARIVDEAEKISARIPVFALTVVGLSLLLLAATFRSFKLAGLSAVLNLVSIAAAYGVVHLLFQTSVGTSLLGIEEQPVVAYVPLFMFAILFGLSTDYNVFLLSRVREEATRLGSVPRAVAVASARTRRTITAAGAIMIVVFCGFATDPDPSIRMTGAGLATAILVDITLVRLLLAPAALTMIGDRLWKRSPAPVPAGAAREEARGVVVAQGR